MIRSQKYFYRNRGDWEWNTQFKIVSWKLFLNSDLAVVRKMIFVLFILSQNIFGNYKMWTEVILGEDLKVMHETKLNKFGLIFMRSKKIFNLNFNGSDLDLNGEEYFWPFISKPHSFQQLKGKVLESGTRANYQMPLFGSICECKVILELDQGEINIRTSWMTGKFELTPKSMLKLRSRFEEKDNI